MPLTESLGGHRLLTLTAVVRDVLSGYVYVVVTAGMVLYRKASLLADC